jgi:hypothetical protein
VDNLGDMCIKDVLKSPAYRQAGPKNVS